MKIFKAIALTFFFLLIATPICASTTQGIIDDVNKYAWSEKIGWINFNPANGNVIVTDEGLSGYAWSSNYGWINLSPTKSGVKNDGNGNLSGEAWNDNLGWVSFSGLTIDEDGYILGTTESEDSNFGRIVFTCSGCKVMTDWRPESIRTSIYQTETQSREKGIEEQDIPENIDEEASSILEIFLYINRSRIKRIEDLIATVNFKSIEDKTIPVTLTFSILDSSGETVYISVDKIDIGDGKSFTKNFNDVPELEDGKYSLVLNTLYDKTKTEELNKEFEIYSKGFNWWLVILPIPILIIIYLFFRKRASR